MDRHIVVTGATGALGSWVLKQLLAGGYRITALTRNQGVLAPGSGVNFVYADITLPELGNPAAAELLRSAHCVIHMAADVRWNRSDEASQLVNTAGTQKLIDVLSGAGSRLERFIHVSTAFVESPGASHPCTDASQREPGSFNNSYEYSKWKAECHVRRCSLPWVIVRPSLIVGDQFNGEIHRYNGIYHLVKAYSLGMMPFLVGDPEARVDVVPVDVVTQAVLAAVECKIASRQTVWAISGSNAPTVRQLMDAASDEINAVRTRSDLPALQAPVVIEPDTYDRLYAPLMKGEIRFTHRRFIDSLNVFRPYLSISGSFTTSSRCYQAPPSPSYIGKCMQNWAEKNKRIALAAAYRWTL